MLSSLMNGQEREAGRHLCGCEALHAVRPRGLALPEISRDQPRLPEMISDQAISAVSRCRFAERRSVLRSAYQQVVAVKVLLFGGPVRLEREAS